METNSDPLRKIQTKHAPEVTTDVGSPLKAARVKKGHSLDAVSQHTRIPKKFLDALEGNRFDEFPALAYLRGFLKSYCDYLEMDFEPLWRQIVPEQQSGAAPPQAAKAKAPSPSSDLPAGLPKAVAPKPPTTAPPKPEASHPAAAAALPTSGLLIVAAIALLAIGGWFMRPRPDGTARVEGAASTPAALQPVNPPAEPHLTLEFRRPLWVSIVIDGAQKFQGNVPQGAKQEWKAKKTIMLRSSDPSGLKLTLNGAPYFLPQPDSEANFRIEAP